MKTNLEFIKSEFNPLLGRITNGKQNLAELSYDQTLQKWNVKFASTIFNDEIEDVSKLIKDLQIPELSELEALRFRVKSAEKLLGSILRFDNLTTYEHDLYIEWKNSRTLKYKK